MSRHPEFDARRIRTQPFCERGSKVRVADFASPPEPGRTVDAFLASLPRILSGPAISEIATAVVEARRAGRAVLASMGGHVVKTGMGRVLAELIERGALTACAVNGAFAIHDAEIALFGETSEDVEEGLRTGLFGMAEETAQCLNEGARIASARGMGLGEALGEMLAGAPHAEASVLASAHRAGIPLTVHVAMGTDVVHMHPEASGAAIGEASLRDFRILTHAMEGLANGGVLMNLGSAVVLPEVLLKAIATLRNVRGDAFSRFLGVNLDFIQHYRSNQQVVSRVRGIGGRGIALTGHHEVLIPLVAQAIVDRWEAPTR
ncbi:MAG TPA: hypothetical protein VLH79_04545 [Chthonomonadales bacterium]|nr:hypothetical protein [Chthonomonadales bacterium]